MAFTDTRPYAYVLFLTLLHSVYAGATEKESRIPEEYLSTGEQSTGLANAGSLSSGGFSAVRANPAMLAADKQYTLGGGYHWPTRGRNYYQAGIVDAKTASVAAGLSYTSSMDDYNGPWDKEGSVEAGDTPIRRRVAVGLAYPFKTFSLGASAGFVEANDPAKAFDREADRVKGFTLGAGAVAGLLPNLRVGLSAENLANKKVAFAAPTIYRAGLVWGAFKDFSIYADLRSREAVAAYDAPPPNIALFAAEKKSGGGIDSEQALTVGGLVRAYDLLRLSLAAGAASQGGRTIPTAAGGIALANKQFTFAYAAQRPNLKEADLHHSVSLGLDVSL